MMTEIFPWSIVAETLCAEVFTAWSHHLLPLSSGLSHLSDLRVSLTTFIVFKTSLFLSSILHNPVPRQSQCVSKTRKASIGLQGPLCADHICPVLVGHDGCWALLLRLQRGGQRAMVAAADSTLGALPREPGWADPAWKLMESKGQGSFGRSLGLFFSSRTVCCVGGSKDGAGVSAYDNQQPCLP